MSIILGIDYGKKRTGIAVTDPLKIIASSFQTIETKLLIDFLRKFVEQNNVDSIVIGLPRQKDHSFSDIENEIQIMRTCLKHRREKKCLTKFSRIVECGAVFRMIQYND